MTAPVVTPPRALGRPVNPNADGSVTVTEAVLAYYAGTDKDLQFVAGQLPRNPDGTITIPAAIASQYNITGGSALIGQPTNVNKQVTIGNGVININKNIQTNQ